MILAVFSEGLFNTHLQPDSWNQNCVHMYIAACFILLINDTCEQYDYNISPLLNC